MGYKNQRNRKCWTYFYRDIGGTFDDLSVKKSLLTVTKQSPKWIKWEERGKPLWYYDRINPVSNVIYTVSTVVVSRVWWRRGGFNPLHFRLHPYFTFNPLVLLMMRHQITDWKEVRLWFDNHQTITKNTRITLTKNIYKLKSPLSCKTNRLMLYIGFS